MSDTKGTPRSDAGSETPGPWDQFTVEEGTLARLRGLRCPRCGAPIVEVGVKVRDYDVTVTTWRRFDGARVLVVDREIAIHDGTDYFCGGCGSEIPAATDDGGDDDLHRALAAAGL